MFSKVVRDISSSVWRRAFNFSFDPTCLYLPKFLHISLSLPFPLLLVLSQPSSLVLSVPSHLPLLRSLPTSTIRPRPTWPHLPSLPSKTLIPSKESRTNFIRAASEPVATTANRLPALPPFHFGSGPPPPPGAWANWIGLKFDTIWNAVEPKSAALQILYGKEMKQDLVLRLAIAHMWTPETLAQRINTASRNFEAAAMQVVGTIREPPNECSACPRNYGPFAHCIVVEGIPGCGNCHWNGRGEECTLNPHPVRHSARHPASQPVRQPARQPAHQASSISESTSASEEGLESTIERMNEVIKAEKAELELLKAMVAEKQHLIDELEDIKRNLTG